MPNDYKASLNLPRTDFPMKADLPVREKEMLKTWEAKKVFAALRGQAGGRKAFVLHDGPPFANGDIHLGHVLNKILKDIIIRHRTMSGFDVDYIPGWDCHGLPIEYQVTRNLKDRAKDPVRVRRESAEYAQRFIQTQKEQFKRLGIWGRWDRPYITMSAPYEAEILRVFAALVEKDLVYQALKPVYWSTGCQTALAEAEIEYDDRTDISIFARFALDRLPEGLAAHADKARGASLLIWTTTPWTLPANLAVAVHPDLRYAVLDDGAERLVACVDRVGEVRRITGREFRVTAEFTGRDLEGATYHHPFLVRGGKVFTGDFVTHDTGSGLVHIAPGHGQDDYLLGQRHGLKTLSPVDDEGRLTEECGVPNLAGRYVFDANADITALLKQSGRLVFFESFRHSYPHCWRSKTPVIFRSVPQWFIRVEAFRDLALELIDRVEWIPSWGKNRIEASVASRRDWCISRQRSWGVPIPVFYQKDGRAFLDAAAIRRFADIVEKEGTGVWFEEDEARFLSRMGLAGSGLARGTDTLDVWIDSGSSFAAVVKKDLSFPADLYLEGSDQHRGWFQSSLLLSAVVTGRAPYKSVLTHGFVVDGEGKKMSKSVGNVISPQDLMKDFGADILRLWVVSSDYADDVRVSRDIFERVSDTYRKFRNTFRYLLGNLAGFDPDKQALPDAELLESDRWALSRLSGLVEEATRYYESCQFHRFYQAVYHFCVKDMSSVYFDILKDRLYADAALSVSGRSARTALFRILSVLARLLAPVTAFTSEEAWSHLPAFAGKKPSVHLEEWPRDTARFRDPVLETRWERLLELREKVLKALEERREKKEIGNSLEAEVECAVFDEGIYRFFEKEAPVLALLCLVSGFSVVRAAGAETGKPEGGIEVRVRTSRGKKCPRCWTWRTDTGRDPAHPDLCGRCAGVMKGVL